MISYQQALDTTDLHLTDLKLGTETLPILQCLGRILSKDQHARLDLPPFDKSAMDGYAVILNDIREQYQLVETVAAGKVGQEKLRPGTTVKVMTGAPVPEGTGRVIMQEYTRQEGETVNIFKHDGPQNLCRKGEDLSIGDPVLPAGTFLGPLEISNLVSCGITQVEVWRRPRVAVISTGDEIVDSPDQIEPGKIVNSNGPMLAMLSKSYGFELVSQTTVPDDLDATIQAVRAAMELADIVMLSGGVSEGDFDFVLKSFSQVGLKVHFSRIAVKPGKPTVFSSSDGKLAFGLPGNPVSSFLMFHLFVLRTVARMTGARPPMREYEFRLAADFRRRKTERLEFVPCSLQKDGSLKALEYHGSAHLAAVLNADGFLLIPRGVAELKAGTHVTYMPLPRVYP